jgi:hypothetical protein
MPAFVRFLGLHNHKSSEIAVYLLVKKAVVMAGVRELETQEIESVD